MERHCPGYGIPINGLGSQSCETLGSEDWRDNTFPHLVPAKASTATSFILVIIMSCISYPKSGQDRET